MKKLIPLLLVGLVGCTTTQEPKPATAPVPPMPPGMDQLRYRATEAGVIKVSAPPFATARKKSVSAMSMSSPLVMMTDPPPPPDPCAPKATVVGTNIHLTWPCWTNVNFRIDTSFDLLSWQAIGTSINTSTNADLATNHIVIVDATAAYRIARYFRVVPVDTNGVRLQ